MGSLQSKQMDRDFFLKSFLLLLLCTNVLLFSAYSQTTQAREIDLSKCWSYPMSETGSELALDSSRVFLGSAKAKVEALSYSGKKLWASELGGDIISNISPLESGLFFVTASTAIGAERVGPGVLRSLSKETGITNWTLKLPDADKYFIGGFNGSVVIVANSGLIHSVDMKSGAVKWSREIAASSVAKPVFTSKRFWLRALATR